MSHITAIKRFSSSPLEGEKVGRKDDITESDSTLHPNPLKYKRDGILTLPIKENER